jgi:hypothetical protein
VGDLNSQDHEEENGVKHVISSCGDKLTCPEEPKITPLLRHPLSVKKLRWILNLSLEFFVPKKYKLLKVGGLR